MSLSKLQELAMDREAWHATLQKDLEELKVLLEKATRKGVSDPLTAEKPKIETELKNKMQQKSQNNYGWNQSDKCMKIYINFTGRSFDLLVKNLNGKSYSMIMNNLLKPISVEGSSKKVKTDTILIYIKKAENTQWNYLTQKIYKDGDDMKRTINKASVESREK
ncbi:hypothetical protein AB1E18_018549 [Capra hircus]